MLVIPADSDLPRDPNFYQPYLGESVTSRRSPTTSTQPRPQLQRQQIDLLVIAPPNVEQQFREWQQSSIDIEYNELDPVRDNYARFIADRQVQQLNQAIIAAGGHFGRTVRRAVDRRISRRRRFRPK